MYWRQWLQTLLCLVILLGVVEMLLPSGELAKFSKLVLGLALMLALLQPLTILLNEDIQNLDLTWISEIAAEPQVQVLAERVQLAATMPFLKEDETALATQIEAVLLSLDYVEDVKVQIESTGQQGTIVHVFLQPFAMTSTEPVGNLVASMLNIPENQIAVKRWLE